MLIARIAPIDSSRFKRLSESVKSLDGFMKLEPINWFALWIMLIAGMSAHAGFSDRYLFWDFSDWLVGIVRLTVVTALAALFLLRPKIIRYDIAGLNMLEIINHIIFAFLLFVIGWGTDHLIAALKSGVPYILAYLAVYVIYTIPYKLSREGFSEEDIRKKRLFYTVLALLLLIVSAIIGFIFDDPVISTANAVYIPFLLVVLFTRHERHLQRARFYPVFILAMFIVSREAWFIVPLVLLFYFLRFYHYFRNKSVCPTFGVDFESANAAAK